MYAHICIISHYYYYYHYATTSPQNHNETQTTNKNYRNSKFHNTTIDAHLFCVERAPRASFLPLLFLFKKWFIILIALSLEREKSYTSGLIFLSSCIIIPSFLSCLKMRCNFLVSPCYWFSCWHVLPIDLSQFSMLLVWDCYSYFFFFFVPFLPKTNLQHSLV